MRTITTWGKGIALLALLCSCAQSRSENGTGTDSTTHWLRSCSSDAECGRLECLCGVCNTSCAVDAECSGLDPDAVCAAVATSCTDTERSCERGPEATSTGSTVEQSGTGGSEDFGTSSSGTAGTSGGGAIDAGCGRPWYECTGCAELRTLQGASRTLASCEGGVDCDFRLRIATAIVLDEGDCTGVIVELTVSNSSGPVRRHIATLTDAAWEQATQLAIELEAVRSTVDDVTGCPTCAGVDASSLVLNGIDQLTQTFSYVRGEPPAALAAADAFVQTLIDQLLACRGFLIYECSINRLDPNPDQASTQCQFTYTQAGNDSAIACGLDPSVESPCRAAVECLCSGPVPPFGPTTDVQGCVDSWFQPRGALTFVDLCSRDPAMHLRSLTEALNEFARTASGTVTANATCDSITAWY